MEVAENMLKNHRWHYVFLALAIFSFILTAAFLLEAVFSKHLSYSLPFVSYGGTFKWQYAKIGPLKLSLYWAAQIVGLAGMCILCRLRKDEYKITGFQSILTGVLLGIFGFIGAKILYTLENLSYVLQNGPGLGGVSFFGTVFFMPIVIPIMGLAMKTDPRRYLDYCTPAGVLMLACIRCGCFMRGCCGGITVWVGANPVIFPTQLMECTLDLILLFLILRLDRSRKFVNGLYAVFMGAYGIIRFALEFLRDTPKSHLGMSNGQWFSILALALSAVYCVIRKTGVKSESKQI